MRLESSCKLEVERTPRRVDTCRVAGTTRNANFEMVMAEDIEIVKYSSEKRCLSTETRRLRGT